MLLDADIFCLLPGVRKYVIALDNMQASANHGWSFGAHRKYMIPSDSCNHLLILFCSSTFLSKWVTSLFICVMACWHCGTPCSPISKYVISSDSCIMTCWHCLTFHPPTDSRWFVQTSGRTVCWLSLLLLLGSLYVVSSEEGTSLCWLFFAMADCKCSA